MNTPSSILTPHLHWRMSIWCCSILIVFAIVARVFLATHYGPVIAGDSHGYLALASMLQTQDFTGYNAWRTPGYPWFLNLFDKASNSVVIAQNVLGLLNVFLVAFVCWKLTRKPVLSFVLGVFLFFSLNLLFLDEYYLTESLATFLFSVCVFWMILDFSCKTRWAWPFSLLGGLSVALLTLTRPQYIALIPAVVFVLLLIRLLVRPSPSVWARLAVFLVSSNLPIVALLVFNQIHIGRFTLSTTSDYNLIHHTIPFIEAAERADPDHLYIPHLIKVREEAWDLVRASGDNRSFIKIPSVDVIPAVVYHELSVEAIKQCPGKYLASVVNAWLRFWRVALIYDADYAHSEIIRQATPAVWRIQKVLWLFCNAVFLSSALLVPFTIFVKRKLGWFECVTIAIIAVSVLQALVEYADNSRFAIPMEPIIALMALYSLTIVSPERLTLASLFSRLICHSHRPSSSPAPCPSLSPPSAKSPSSVRSFHASSSVLT